MYFNCDISGICNLPRTTKSDKLILCAVVSVARNTGIFFMPVTRLSKRLGVSRSTIYRAFKKLKARNWVEKAGVNEYGVVIYKIASWLLAASRYVKKTAEIGLDWVQSLLPFWGGVANLQPQEREHRLRRDCNGLQHNIEERQKLLARQAEALIRKGF